MKAMKERFEMMKRFMDLVRGIVRQRGGGEFSEANRRSVVRSQLRSPKGAGHQSLGQRPRNYGEGRFSQACDEFVLGVPAADCGRLDEAKARDPERSLTGKTSGGSQNLEVEGSSGILTMRKPRALPWALVSRPFRAIGNRIGEAVGSGFCGESNRPSLESGWWG